MDGEIVDFSFDDMLAQLEPPEDVFENLNEKRNDENDDSGVSSKKQESEEIEESVQNDVDVLEDNLDFSQIAGALENPDDIFGNDDSSLEDEKLDDSQEVEKSKDFENPKDFQNSENLLEESDSKKEKLSEDELLIKKEKIIAVMESESDLLDKILEVQGILHSCVREKNWDLLNERLEELQNLSDEFSSLEEERESLCEEIDIQRDFDVSPVLVRVRGKLQKSKIENHVLNEYISTTRKFLQGVFDSVVPQRRNTLYSRTGKIIRNEPTAVAVDIEL